MKDKWTIQKSVLSQGVHMTLTSLEPVKLLKCASFVRPGGCSLAHEPADLVRLYLGTVVHLKSFSFFYYLQLSPAAHQMQPSQPSHSQHAMQAGGSCSGGGGGGAGGGGGVGSNRRRRTSEQDPDERRQKFLERNRAAATRCRQKRKLWVSSLEKKAEELTHTNLQLQVGHASVHTHVRTHTNTIHTRRILSFFFVLVCSQNEVTSLRSEVGQLKQILLTHKDCPVTARQREAQGYPSE